MTGVTIMILLFVYLPCIHFRPSESFGLLIQSVPQSEQMTLNSLPFITVTSLPKFEPQVT